MDARDGISSYFKKEGMRMERVSIIHKEITYMGRIIIATRLDQEFYDYTTGAEKFAFDRIAAELFELTCDIDTPPGGVVMSLDSMVPIGAEIDANRIPTWLVVRVTSVDRSFTLIEEFEKFITLTAAKVMEKLIRKGSAKAAVEVGDKDYYVITKND